MPTELPENSVIQVTMVGDLYGQQILNTQHYYNTTSQPDYRATMNEIIDLWDQPAGILEAWMLAVGADYRCISLNAQPVYPTRLAAVKRATLTNGIGTNVGDAAPSNVAAVLTKTTDFAGRDQIGSIHIAGCPKDQIDGDEWSPLFTPNLGQIANSLSDPLTVGGFVDPYKWVLWSPGTPTVTADITGVLVQLTVRTMRRRTKGVGK